MELDVTITKTRTGTQDYIQIFSDDQISVNICLVADEIRVSDHRVKIDVEELARELFGWSADPHTISECEEYIRSIYERKKE